jgi:hypothetical protein
LTFRPMHGVYCERQFSSHFHPSLLISDDEEVHLFGCFAKLLSARLSI